MRDFKSLIINELRSIFSQLAFVPSDADSLLDFVTMSGISFGDISTSKIQELYSDFAVQFAYLTRFYNDPPSTLFDLFEAIQKLSPLLEFALKFPAQLSTFSGISFGENEELGRALIDYLPVTNLRRRRPFIFNLLSATRVI